MLIKKLSLLFFVSGQIICMQEELLSDQPFCIVDLQEQDIVQAILDGNYAFLEEMKRDMYKVFYKYFASGQKLFPNNTMAEYIISKIEDINIPTNGISLLRLCIENKLNNLVKIILKSPKLEMTEMHYIASSDDPHPFEIAYYNHNFEAMILIFNLCRQKNIDLIISLGMPEEIARKILILKDSNDKRFAQEFLNLLAFNRNRSCCSIS